MLEARAALLWEVATRVSLSVALFLITLALARRIRRRVAVTGPLAAKDRAVAALISNLVYVGLIALGIATILPILNVELTAVVTALGVTGLAVSLALQDVLRNFVAGIYILLEKPFNLGDRIALRDFDGEVQSIELRTTLLRTRSGAQVIVPNSVVMTDIVTNRSLGQFRAYSITVSGTRSLVDDGLEPFLQVLRASGQIARDPVSEAVVESIEEDRLVVPLDFHAEKDSTTVAQTVRGLEQRFPEAVVGARANEE